MAEDILQKLLLAKRAKLYHCLSEIGVPQKTLDEICENPTLIQQIANTILGKPSDYFDRLSGSIYNTSKQNSQIRMINESPLTPDYLKQPEIFFDNVFVDDSHPQTFHETYVQFAKLKTFEESVLFNWELIRQMHFSTEFEVDIKKLSLDPSNRIYNSLPYGISTLLIDFAPDWPNPRIVRLDEIRETAIRSDYSMAGPEGFAAVGATDPSLIKRQNGIDTPFFAFAGNDYDHGGEVHIYWNQRWTATVSPVTYDQIKKQLTVSTSLKNSSNILYTHPVIKSIIHTPR